MSRNRHNYIITFTDYLRSSFRTVPISCDDIESFPATTLADAYFTQIFRYHGLPSAVNTDQGSMFTSEFWTLLMTLCCTNVRTSTAYHCETKGLTERANRTIIYSLKHYLHSLYETWDEHLIGIEFAYNTSIHPTTGITPFEALYGFNPRSPLTLDAHTYLSPSKSSHYLEVIRSRIDAARDHLLQTQLTQAAALNKRRHPHAYAAGQQVWLSIEHLNLSYPKKFKPSYLGPFTISNMTPHSNCTTLDLPPTLSQLHPMFNNSLFKPYNTRDPCLGPFAHAHPMPVFSDATSESLVLPHRVYHRGTTWLGTSLHYQVGQLPTLQEVGQLPTLQEHPSQPLLPHQRTRWPDGH